MIVVNYAAVGADGHINTGFFIVFVSCGSDLDKSGSLSPADALGLSGDADGAAADADLYEVRACLCEEEEAVSVDHVACADLYGVAVFLTDKCEGLLLPYGVALGGIYAEHVCACINESGNASLIVESVDTCADNVALVGVKQLLGILLMLRIILPEYKIEQLAVLVDDGQRVELIFPNYIVSVFKSGVLVAGNELVKRSHEF